MKETYTLIYPTIDLFSYDYAEKLGDDENSINQNRKIFWQRVYGDDLTEAQLEASKQFESENSDYI